MKPDKKAFFELLFAGFLFSFMGVFGRLISHSMGTFLQAFIRFVFMLILFWLIGHFKKIFIKIDKKDLPLMFLRGVFIITDFYFFIYAVSNLSLGIVMFAYYTLCVITSYIYGSIFLKEKLSTTKIISLSLAIIGLYVMNKTSFGTIKIFPLLASFMSGICFGLNMSTSKKLTTKYNVIQLSIVSYLLPFILAIPMVFLTHEIIPTTIPLIVFIELFAFALCLVGAVYFTLIGYKKIEAQKASIIMLSELIFVVILGLLLYHEIPTIYTIMGGVLILAALILPNINVKIPYETNFSRLKH